MTYINTHRIRPNDTFTTLVYLPGPSLFDAAADRARAAGARVVREGLPPSPSAHDLTRVGLDDRLPGDETHVLLASDHSLDLARLEERLNILTARGQQVWAEVTSPEMALLCEKAGANTLVACGFEGPGVVSEDSSLVLLRRLLATSSLPVYVRGGIGPDSAAAVVAIGAAGYVLDYHLWLSEEYPTSDALRARLETFNPTDTRCLGMTLGLRFRAFALVATRSVRDLAAREVTLLAEDAGPRAFYNELRAAQSSEPWDLDVRAHLWPLGQEAALAAPLNAHFGSAQNIIEGIANHVRDTLDLIDADFPLAEGKGIALANGTRYPIHQGPMAQVSDTPAFARAVALAGSMPWLALGNMPVEIAEDIVDGTSRAVEGLPYGAGIIGLDANPHRDGHIEMLKQINQRAPLMALVAAGTAEQAMQFEGANITTYLHTPTPGILNAALKSGQTRFILEGSEAGGHVGSLGSLILWQLGVLEIELALAQGADPSSFCVVAAGGIGDPEGAAAAAALLFGLHRRGVHVGIQMGTAYLMTREAVETGAVSALYQTTARQARKTLIMGESVGTPTRVLESNAARVVLGQEKSRLANKVDLKQRKHLYELDNLGGLRAAAKAQRISHIDTARGAIFESLTAQEQSDTGLFHCGQGVVFCDEDFGIDDLHVAVTDGARRLIATRRTRASEGGPKVTPIAFKNTETMGDTLDADQTIAIIGVGARMPGALSAAKFWENIEQGVNSISDVPADRWDPEAYWDEDPRAEDKTYSKIGGWVTGFVFDRKAFRLPPAVVASMDPTQLLCLEAVREALEDAGYLDRDFDRTRCAVILGNALGGDLRDSTNQRVLFPDIAKALRKALLELSGNDMSPEAQKGHVDALERHFKADLPPITEDSMPGELANVVAGRVASVFDLRGPNYITDAACASSLAAIDAAVRGLRTHQFDMCVTGGADSAMGPTSFVKFAKIGALSPNGSRPFDAEANGFVMGEGAGAIILKRLADARRDGDTIYALIRGVGGASDGRGKAITAPNPEGQMLAMRRAYKDAGINPRTVSLIEAHGTSTPVGDPVEVSSIAAVLAESDHPLVADRIALGSVKSNIGHLKSAAGAASIIKVAMALKHRILPPTINVNSPNPALNLEASPFRIQTERQPWNTFNGAPRRAGISAFGFGGTNFHIVLEEYNPQGESMAWKNKPTEARALPVATPTVNNHEGILAIAADSRPALRARFTQLLESVAHGGTDALQDHLLPVYGPRVQASIPRGSSRIAIVFTSIEELTTRLEKTARAFETDKGWRVLANQGIFLSEVQPSGKVAMLFPGQGTQYLGMLSALKDRFPIIRQTFDEADAIMGPVLDTPLSSIIDPDLKQIDELSAFEALMQTEVTQPAVLTADVALYRLLGELGIAPDLVAGHSLGEYGACVAAGVMSFRDALLTVATRGTAMAQATPMNGDNGLMASIPAGVDVVQPVLDTLDGYVVCANVNCPGQTIIAGLTDTVKAAVARFEALGLQVVMLPVSHAFHTEVVAAASRPLRQHLASVEISSPTIPILTNVTGDFYPEGPNVADQIRDLLSEQVAAPVQFIDLIERMYARGARTFIEVGPKRAQASFVSNILEGRDHLAIYTNHPKKGDVASLYDALAELYTRGLWNEQTIADDPIVIQDASPSVSRDTIVGKLLDVLCEKTGYERDEIELDFELEADLGIDTVKQAEIMSTVREHFNLVKDEAFRLAEFPTLARLADYVEARLPGESRPFAPPMVEQALPLVTHEATSSLALQTSSAPSRDTIVTKLLDVLCEKTGYERDEIELDFELEADLGIDTVKQAEIMSTVREHFNLVKDEAFRLAEYPTLARLADYVEDKIPAGNTPAQGPAEAPAQTPDPPASLIEARDRNAPYSSVSAPNAEPVATTSPATKSTKHKVPADVVISGSALGLPGMTRVFDELAIERLLEGTNFITSLSETVRQSMVDKRIVRLKKHHSGGGDMVEVTETSEVIKLSGQGGAFDLTEWAVPERFIESLDPTSQLAIAAGLDALRDAGIPLIPRYRETKTGKKITIGWTLPESVGDRTGVIFASAFAGQDALIEELQASHKPHYQFNHRFLLRVLGIANARFAEYIGARGPNTRINNACASTTTALAMAQDWIRAQRCDRVVILSADDASGPHLMEWIASGFLATGAATTEEDVANAALPFDRRRNGMIIGMGALALVVEKGGLPEARGMEPIADLLATRLGNSAFHPTRLDVDHIANEVAHLIGEAERKFDLDRAEMAPKMAFISHETYTPARGGSAAAEISALRHTFADKAHDVVIANTKGFTGHAMGAGIEDILAIKILQHERVPPIANFKEADPDLGDLRLSQGGEYKIDYALRLAAGFGSQLALALLRFRARGEDRIIEPALMKKWLGEISGFENPVLEVEHRNLRLRNAPLNTALTTPTPEIVIRDTSMNQPMEQPIGLAHPFAFKPVVVEAHTAASFDIIAMSERLKNRRIAIVAGPMLVTDLMQRAAERCGAHVLVIADRQERSPLDLESSPCDLLDEHAIARELESFGPVDGIINLLGFGHENDTPDEIYLAARRTYHLARAWAAHLGGEPAEKHFFVSITGMGGRLGFDHATTPLPLCGAIGGITKALAREWSQASVRVVDVAREGFYPELGLQILAEAFNDAPCVEIGLIGGIRYVPVLIGLEDLSPVNPRSFAPTQEDVVLITGGGRGITAEIAVDIAKRHRSRLAIVGRTFLSHPNPLAIDMEAEKERVKAELTAQHERVTPLMVRSALSSLEAQRAIAQNIERMRALGSDVEYFSCDVADGAQIEVLIERIHDRFGRIDGVIHGAGAEESKLLADKDVKSFDRVFRGKALGGLHLWKALKTQRLSFFVAFSSVAGRFGNAGQTDYSAANEVLSKLVMHINATTSTPALTIDWTAWDDVGMAVEGSMRTILEARGVEFLPVHIGAPMVAQAFALGLTGEVVVAGELGELAGGRVIDLTSTPRTATPYPALVDAIVEHTEGKKIIIERIFDPEQDYFIDDHVYEGVAVLPGVMGYELMVNAAQLLSLGKIREVRNARFERAVKLHRGEPLRLVATAEVKVQCPNDVEVDVVVESIRESRTGRALRQEHYRARVILGEPKTVAPLVTLDAAELWARGPERNEIYQRFFHTGLFRVLSAIPLISKTGIVGNGRVPATRLVSPGRSGEFLTAPLVREMALQTAGLWGMVHLGQSFLPLGIGKSHQLTQVRPGEEICIRCHRRDDAEEGTIAFDVDILSEHGELLQVMEKVELIGHRKLLPEERFNPVNHPLIQLLQLNDPEASLLLNDRNLELMNILAQHERAAFERLQSPRRRAEWMASRVAAKELVRCHVRDLYGESLTLADIEIVKDEHGAPRVELPRRLAHLTMPPLSITHSGGVAIAAITTAALPSGLPGYRIGLDLEMIERRDPSFTATYFLPRELDLVLNHPCDVRADEPTLTTALWTAKEAVMKALGLGMHLRPQEIVVTAFKQDEEVIVATIDLEGRAKTAFEALRAEDLRVELVIEGRRARSIASFKVGAAPGQPTATAGEDSLNVAAAVAALLKHKNVMLPAPPLAPAQLKQNNG